MGYLLSKLAFLSVIGFAAVTMAGPVLGLLGVVIGLIVAVVSVALPFALIGFVIWLPFYLLNQYRTRQPQVARQWRPQQQQQQQQQQQVGAPAFGQWQQQQQQQVIPPAPRQRVRVVGESVASTWHDCQLAGHAVGGILMETLCGAGALGILGGLFATDLPPQQIPGYVFVGAALGALFGFIIGLTNYAQTRHTLCQDSPRET